MNRSAEAIRNNFSPAKEDRYYLQEDDIDSLETEFPTLVNGQENNRLKLSFGSSHQKRGEHRAYDDVDAVIETILQDLSDASELYATISYQSSYPVVAVQMMYQGSATESVVDAIVRNADAIVTQLKERTSYK